MLQKVRSLGLQGLQGYEVTAECDLAGGLPAFDMVGLPDAAVKEARERVRAAARNSGFPFPQGRITVNLAPADMRKEGAVYDLPVALSILGASGQLVGALAQDRPVHTTNWLHPSGTPVHRPPASATVALRTPAPAGWRCRGSSR